MKAVGPSKQSVSQLDITQLPPVILGGAVLNTQYNDDPQKVPIIDIIKYAFDHGVCAIDTSPYYGNSEAIYGEALDAIKNEYPRDTYFICTKVGRYGDKFDYSREQVRSSVLESCRRLRTEYLDLVYLHDIEFVPFAETLEALKELRKLKNEGIIRNFGLSGYPLDYLHYTVKQVTSMKEIGALDAILSYCNLNLQNKLLKDKYKDLYSDGQLSVICNGSILSMSLLTSQDTRYFHPCSTRIRNAAKEASALCKLQGVELADLATRYAMSEWKDKGPTVIGVSSVEELAKALENYWIVQDRGLDARDQKLIDSIQNDVFREVLNETWPSGIEHPELG